MYTASKGMTKKKKISKAETVLKKIQNYIGGELRISQNGVPHLVLDNNFSICYFVKSKSLRTFIAYMRPENRKYMDFKEHTELVRYFHYQLGFEWVGNWKLD